MKFATRWSPAPLLALLVAGSIAVSGCGGARRPPPKRPSAGGAAQRDARGLLSSILSQLRTLPESAQLELTPPMVVLDARSTTDGEDIQGILSRRPEAPDGPANLVTVPRGNTRFRNTVKPGDILKYYGTPDRDTQDRLRETGEVDIATFDSIDMVVAQVLSEDSLLIVGGFSQEDNATRKIEVWRIVDERMQEIQREWSAYVARREPPLAWHPTPDESSIGQLTERLNQWLRQVGAAGKRAEAGDWKRPELLATLPEALAAADNLKPYLSDNDLATGYFRPYESRLVQGATWRRDVARWARGADTDPLAIATSLLDWTARNVQLVEPAQTPPRWPWEAMLLGQADAAGRAWVLAGLCEQQNLTAAVVSVPAAEEGAPAYPLVGVADGDQLRLFDPSLGVPVPGTGAGSIATLAEAQADDAVLRRLDLDGAPYPVSAEQLQKATVAVVASPFALTRRAGELASRLTADDALALAVDPDKVAERLKALGGVGGVVLWDAPFQTLLDKLTAKPSQRRQAVREFLPFAWRPALWRGRLQHFRGVREDASAKRDVLDETLDDHLAAQRLYMDRNVRPTDDRLASVPEDKQDIYRSARTLATLFLATLRYDEASYEVATQWLDNSAMDDDSAEPFRPMVQYLRGRALQRRGETEKAIEALESVEGPMAPGAKLLARRLREEPAPQESADEPPAEADPDANEPEASDP